MANCDCEVALVSGPLGLTSPQTTLGAGAIVEFLGNVRPLENGKPIEGIEYEAHREMAEYQLRKIAREAGERFDLRAIRLHAARPAMFLIVPGQSDGPPLLSHRGVRTTPLSWPGC